MAGALFLNLPLYIRHLSVKREFSEWKSGFTLYFSQCESFLTLWRYLSLNQFLATKRYGYLFISHRNNFWKFPLELTALAAMLTVSCEVQPCTHADSTLCSMRYWLLPLVTGLFLARSACYWPVPWLFRLLLTCSLLVPLVTGLFRLFRVLETSFIFHRNRNLQGPLSFRSTDQSIPYSLWSS